MTDEDNLEGHHVAPCPFCDSDVVEIRKQWNNATTVYMGGGPPRELVCVRLHHHCAKGSDEFETQYMELRARDVASAIKMWNRPWKST